MDHISSTIVTQSAAGGVVSAVQQQRVIFLLILLWGSPEAVLCKSRVCFGGLGQEACKNRTQDRVDRYTDDTRRQLPRLLKV